MKSKKLLATTAAMTLAFNVLAFVPVFSGTETNSPYEQTQLDSDLNSTVKPDHITLTWSDNPETTQTITWRTNTKVTQGKVKFKEQSVSSYSQSEAVQGQLFENSKSDSVSGKMNLFTVTLKNLKPGTKYTYMVGDGDNWSDANTFTTEAKDTNKFKFMIFGDSQSGIPDDPNYIPWHKTITNAYTNNNDAKFFMNMGDLVEIGQYYNHWNSWFNATKGVIDNIPAMPVQGNHETYLEGKNWTTGKPAYYANQFNLYQNGPDGLKNQTYSFDYGNAHFVVLDSQENEESVLAKAPDIFKPQEEWLDKDLSAHKDAKWKFVFFHKPPYYNKSVRSNQPVKEAFCKIFDKYHVDVVFNGHDHGVSRTYPINNDEFVDSTSKGTVYYVTGRSGNKYYKDLSSKIWDAKFYDPQAQPCYETVQINNGALTITSLNQDGSLIDKYVIDKDNQSNSTYDPIPSKFNAPRLVVYGTPLTLGKGAKVVDGKVYVDLPYIATLIGATYDDKAMKLSVTDDDDITTSYQFDTSMFTKDGIDINTLNKVAGFSNRYDTQLNAVYIEK